MSYLIKLWIWKNAFPLFYTITLMVNGFINSEKNQLPGHKIPLILLFTTCITCCCVSVLICLFFLCVICTDLGFELCSFLFKILISKNGDLRFYWLFCNYSSKAFIFGFHFCPDNLNVAMSKKIVNQPTSL